jgi:hypothetical protein
VNFIVAWEMVGFDAAFFRILPVNTSNGQPFPNLLGTMQFYAIVSINMLVCRKLPGFGSPPKNMRPPFGKRIAGTARRRPLPASQDAPLLRHAVC